MTDAPEKIWAGAVTENYGEWQTTTDGLPRPTEYVRSDLVVELAAENERLKQRLANHQRATSTVEARETANVSDKPEGQKEPVAWGEFYGGKIATVRTDKSRHCTVPLFTRPSEQAVTEAMVDVAARAIANAWGETWECCCTAKRGLDCDCGDAMEEERDGYDERLSRDDCRMAARAALKAAMEAGR